MEDSDERQDCEVLAKKHHLEFSHAAQVTWLTGQLWFKCRNCPAHVVVDRFQFYLAISVRNQ